MPELSNISGVYCPPPKKNAALACFAQRLSAFTSSCGADTAGRGGSEPTSGDGARTKRFYRELQFRESHTEAEAETKSRPNSRKKE